jgi:hypothetical protein
MSMHMLKASTFFQEAAMKKLGTTFLILLFFVITGFSGNQSHGGRKGQDFYRTFEIIDIIDDTMVLQDNDGNLIVVDKDPANFKIGYKVRYDSVRKRLRAYRWQDYEVVTISRDSIKLKHKTGDILSVKGNYTGKYEVGDLVRYDSVDSKLQRDDDSGQWRQYTVVAASSTEITLESKTGQQIILHMDNNLYLAPRGIYIGKYKVGDLVRYNAASNKLKKGEIRTYDWQEYEIKEVTKEHLVLLNKLQEELILENTYGSKFNAGDRVKYDRLNNLLKKTR